MTNDNLSPDNSAIQPWSFWAGLPAGFLIGGLAGAMSMFLLAPRSGKKTRAMLRRQGRELGELAAETVGDAVTQVRTTAHQIA